jgi:hypothetical protein
MIRIWSRESHAKDTKGAANWTNPPDGTPK